MNIETERLSLQEITIADLEHIHSLHSIPEVDEFNTLGLPKDINETRELMQPLLDGQHTDPRKTYEWKVLLKDTGEFIGLSGYSLSCDKYRLGEIYYKLSPVYWGYGYATEIAKALVKTGFETFGLHKVEAGVDTENVKSIRVLEKTGMTREGRRRKILPIRGEWRDNYHYAIVEDDPRDY